MTFSNFSFLEPEFPILLNIDQLPHSILAKAFRGELVRQKMKEYEREAGELGMVAESVVDYHYKSR